MRSMESYLKKIGLIGAATAVAAAIVLFACDPSRVPIYPVCLFHRLTGLNCPGCGSLRAMHQLLHGNVVAALHFNALLVVSLPLFAWVGFRVFRQATTGAPTVAVKPFWLWMYLGISLAFGILRELPTPLFASWSP
jgi:hypothetical protein